MIFIKSTKTSLQGDEGDEAIQKVWIAAPLSAARNDDVGKRPSCAKASEDRRNGALYGLSIAENGCLMNRFSIILHFHKFYRFSIGIYRVFSEKLF